jgi:transcriptional regulator with XRE-family HTH domain
MTPDPSPDPTIHRRRLRNELRRARELANKTQKDVAVAMDWSASKLIRIETGAVNISTNDLRALLNFYEVDQDRIAALVEVARAAREAPRWSLYRDVASPEYIAFLGYESSASIIRNFEPLTIPGLLQTEEYARETIRIQAAEQATAHQLDNERIDALVDLRMQRQELLVRDAPPRLHFIVDEGVIRRRVGGPSPDVMRRQLRRLRELADEDHVTIRVVPYVQGLYARFRVAYVLLEFANPEDEDVLYIENPLGEFIVRENAPDGGGHDTPIGFLAAFWELEQVASRHDVPAIIDDEISRLRESG